MKIKKYKFFLTSTSYAGIVPTLWKTQRWEYRKKYTKKIEKYAFMSWVIFAALIACILIY